MPFKQRKKTTWICRQPISTLLSLAKAHEFCHQSSGLAVLKKRLLVWPRFQFLRKHFLPLFLLEITSLGKTCWIDSFLRAISFYAGNSIFSVVCCCCSTKNYSSPKKPTTHIPLMRRPIFWKRTRKNFDLLYFEQKTTLQVQDPDKVWKLFSQRLPCILHILNCVK